MLNKYIKHHSVTQWHERMLLFFAPASSNNTPSHLCSLKTWRFQHIELSQSSCLVFCSQTEPSICSLTWPANTDSMVERAQDLLLDKIIFRILSAFWYSRQTVEFLNMNSIEIGVSFVSSEYLISEKECKGN